MPNSQNEIHQDDQNAIMQNLVKMAEELNHSTTRVTKEVEELVTNVTEFCQKEEQKLSTKKNPS